MVHLRTSFFEALRPHSAEESRKVNLKLLCDLNPGEVAAVPQCPGLLILLRSSFFLAAAKSPARSGGGEAGERSLSVEIPLELSERGKHMEDELAAGRWPPWY